jgi:hypothetical protein
MTAEEWHCATLIHADNHYHRSCQDIVLLRRLRLCQLCAKRLVLTCLGDIQSLRKRECEVLARNRGRVASYKFSGYIQTSTFSCATQRSSNAPWLTRQNGRSKRNDFKGVIFYNPPPFIFLYENSYRDHYRTMISTCYATMNIKLFYFTTAMAVSVRVLLIATKF